MGWTTKDVADQAGVSERTIWKYENGLLSDELMDISILQKLGKFLTGNPQSYLTDYHRWITTTAHEDIRWLMANHSYQNLNDLSLACHTTHRSLYLWRKGIGQPNFETWKMVKSLREKTKPS